MNDTNCSDKILSSVSHTLNRQISHLSIYIATIIIVVKSGTVQLLAMIVLTEKTAVNVCYRGLTFLHLFYVLLQYSDDGPVTGEFNIQS